MWVCKKYIGYVDKGDKMVNTYSVQDIEMAKLTIFLLLS